MQLPDENKALLPAQPLSTLEPAWEGGFEVTVDQTAINKPKKLY